MHVSSTEVQHTVSGTILRYARERVQWYGKLRASDHCRFMVVNGISPDKRHDRKRNRHQQDRVALKLYDWKYDKIHLLSP